MPEFGLPVDEQMVANQYAFLEEALGESKAWGGGRPTTVQGQEYILDYLSQYGVAPSPRQVSAFTKGMDTTWLPGSIMGGLGFKTWEEYSKAQSRGESFGVHTGEGYGRFVPSGGIVALDESGQPAMRYMDLAGGRAQAAIRSGQYITPPGTDIEGAPRGYGAYNPLEGEVPQYDPSQYYRQAQPFEGTKEDALGSFAPTQVYQARVYDYLSALEEKDAPEVQRLLESIDIRKQELDAMLSSGEIPKEQYNSALERFTEYTNGLLANLMTADKFDTIADEIADLIVKGTAAEDLPLFAESQGTEGASVMDLLNKGMDLARQRWEQEQPPEWKGYSQEGQPAITGTEERDYYSLVQSLGLAAEVEQYMMGRYYEFWTQWKRSGQRMPFLEWLRIQMGG